MNKRKVKAIQKLSERLPESWEIIKFGRKRMGSDIIAERGTKDIGIDILPNVVYSHPEWKSQPINHENRLRKAYNRNGEKGMMEYILQLDINNMNLPAKYKRITGKVLGEKVKRVDKRIMKIAEGKASSFWSSIIKFLFAFISVFSNQKEEHAEV